jgi:[ribosomal protein S18]-alanine N-acetyltransferase
MSSAPQCEFQLVPGVASDIDSVVSIMQRAFDPQFGEAWTRSQCLGILPLAGVRLTLARSRDDECLGFSLVRTVADEAELLLLAVLPEAQHRGIGGSLINDFIHSSKSAGAVRLHLEVRDGNRALDTYRRFGFQLAGRRPSYYAGGDGRHFDALTLARTL